MVFASIFNIEISHKLPQIPHFMVPLHTKYIFLPPYPIKWNSPNVDQPWVSKGWTFL